MTTFEPERILEILVDEGVDFVTVGGYAATLRGASRPTEDVDVTPSTTTDILARLTKANQRLNAKIRGRRACVVVEGRKVCGTDAGLAVAERGANAIVTSSVAAAPETVAILMTSRRRNTLKGGHIN